jgi:hypothetical protein
VKRVLALLTAVLVLLTGGVASAGTAGPVVPPEDPFYTPPSTLPDAPGALIRSRPFTAYESVLVNLGQLIPIPARGWQIMYTSRDAGGEPIAVTGSLFVPPTPWPAGARPVVAFTPGTVGPADHCAPSYALARGTEHESLLLTPLLAAGYAVVVPDFQGMGVPGGATYVTGISEGHVTLDAVRAAGQVGGASVSSAAQVAVSGYSQGGGAAAWAGQLKDSYAPELDLKAVAAGGVPGSLVDLLAALAEQPRNLHLRVMILLGLHYAYPQLPWSGLLTPLGERKVAELETECQVDPGLAGVFGTDSTAAVFTGLTFADVFRTDPLTVAAWRSAALTNSPGDGRLAAPTLMYGSPADELVPYSIQRDVYSAYTGHGSAVEWQTTPPLSHAAADLAWAPVAAAWITARFTGRGDTP